MGMRELEVAVLAELRQVSKKPKLRLKDLMEWRTGKDSVKAEKGETLYYLPDLGVSCAVKIS